MGETSFVDYLNRYTTVSADHEAAFDEYLSEVSPPPGGPLRLSTKVEAFIKERFDSARPPSVILTGNAGDGKTYLSRQVIDTFSQNGFVGWSDNTDWSINRGDLTLRVIKDLSELDLNEGTRKLIQLAESLEEVSSKTVFLIAANEGRLRKLLMHDALSRVRHEVNRQLEGGAPENALIVINLNETTTSSYVPQALAWLTDEANWPDFGDDPAHCPIHFNVLKMRSPFVQERIQLLYRILEHLGVHLTIRDMLIHLAFTVTGGRTREDYRDMPPEEAKAYIYYNNLLGLSASPVFRQRCAAIHHLTKLSLGDYSGFELDNFIINGHEQDHAFHSEHQGLFSPAPDLAGRRFQQDRDAYLFGNTPQDGTRHPFLEWLPHCRRKLFLEWPRVGFTEKLFLFATTAEYLGLLEDPDPPKLDRYLRELVLGLNRAFSGLFLTDDETLYLTTQYAHSEGATMPIVRLQLPVKNGLELDVMPLASETVDRDRKQLTLTVYPPRRIKDAEPTAWPIDLMLFEYLLRRARGGTPSVLAAECDLHVRRMKDDLTTAIVLKERTEDKINFLNFLASQPHGYELMTLYLGHHGKIRVS